MKLIRMFKFFIMVLRLGRLTIFKARDQEWYSSPAHALLELLGSAAHIRQHKRIFRKFYVEVAALRKFRELVHGRDFIAKAKISETQNSTSLVEGLQGWYVKELKENVQLVGIPLHTTLFLDTKDARPMDMFAMMLSSGIHNNISFVWDDEEIPYSYFGRHGFKKDENYTIPDNGLDKTYDLAAKNLDEKVVLERTGAPVPLQEMEFEGRRRVNNLIKATRPGSIIVSVSFTEDELGFCDEALIRALPAFRTLHERYPEVLFCLVNRTYIDVKAPIMLKNSGILPVRSRGLNYLSTLALIDKSSIFIGNIGEFSNIAIGHQKKGLYIGPIGGDRHDEVLQQWFLVKPTNDTIIEIIANLLEQEKPNLSQIEVYRPPGKKEHRETVLPSEHGKPAVDKSTRSELVGKPNLETTDGLKDPIQTSKWYVPPGKRRSITLYIDIFGYCNLRCPSCPVGNWPSDGEKAYTSGLIDEGTLRAILEKALAESDVSSVGLFNWTEPLLNPNVNNLIKVVRSFGLKCSISSNLNVLKDPRGLLESGLDWLRISVSGFYQETYGQYHKNGNIDEVKKNLYRLAKERDEIDAGTDIEVFFHKYVDNDDDEIKMKAFAEKLGFRFVSAWAYLMPVEKMLAVADPGDKNATQLTAQDQKLISRLALEPTAALKVTRKKKTNTCGLYDFLTIDIRGNIFLCCATSGRPQNKIANYLDESLQEIYEKQLRHSICGSCLKNGLPELYGHSHDEFIEIGNKGREEWKSRSIKRDLTSDISPKVH